MCCILIISLNLAMMSLAADYELPSRQVPDSLYVVADTTLAADTVAIDSVKVRDKGFDVRQYLNTARYKAPTHTLFNRKSFFSNVFIGVRGSADRKSVV